MKLRKRRKPKRKKKSNPKSCKFHETPVGHFIKTRCPLEWKLLQEIAKSRKARINADDLEDMLSCSPNPSLRTPEFRMAFIDFRKYGYTTPNKKEFDSDEELYLIKRRLASE